MLAQGPMTPPSRQTSPKSNRNVGSRRIFPAHFKLQVLDAYRHDNECKGNQRATARKFNVHRRQIQKWLQCERALRASVADVLRYDATQPSGPGQFQPQDNRLESARHDPGSRIYKHEARTLKLVAQKLYPSSYNRAIVKDIKKGEVINSAAHQCFVPKEYQLNDTHHEAIAPSGYKLSINDPVCGLILKESVGGLKLCGSKTVSKSPQLIPTASPPPRILARPQPMFNNPVNSPYGDEPYNLVVSPTAKASCASSPPISLRPSSPLNSAAAPSPLPARVAEIVADSKTSAFSPKRKWLQDSLMEKTQTEPLPLTTKSSASELPSSEPKAKKPCPDFSIERLCGTSATKESDVKTEVLTPPPALLPVAPHFPPPLVFPPPLLMPHRTIPELMSLHFKPDVSPSDNMKEETIVSVKEEAPSDEDEPIDVLSTSPTEEKGFEFPLGFQTGKRRSFSVQFKLDVLDAFYNDKDCNQNQRATARKFNINRRQVQKWLNAEDNLRCEGSPPCARCPHHCISPTSQQCQDQQCVTGFCAFPSYPTYNVPWIMPAIY